MNIMDLLQRRLTRIKDVASISDVQRRSGVAYDIILRAEKRGADAGITMRTYLRIDEAVREIENELNLGDIL